MNGYRGLLWGLVLALPLWVAIVAFTAAAVAWILP